MNACTSHFLSFFFLLSPTFFHLQIFFKKKIHLKKGKNMAKKKKEEELF
jgi:hypothetical protein